MGEISKNHRTEIVIVGWNHADLTQRCINSVHNNTNDAFVTYVDNGSDNPPALHLYNCNRVYLPTNTGYCHGTNVGLALSLLSDSEYVLLLNNDCEIPQGDTTWLERMIQWMEHDKEIGAVGAVSDTVFGYQKRNRPPEKWLLRQEKLQYVPALIGFCQLIRKSALEQVGLLDERFDPDGNWSDYDYSIRLRNHGWKLAIAESVFVNHVGSATQKDLDFNANLTKGRRLLNEKWGDKNALASVGLAV